MKFCVKNFAKIVLFSALMVGNVSCVNFNKVRVRNADFEYFTPTGLKGANWSFKVGVENGSRAFTISDIEGTIYSSGTAIGNVTAADVVVTKGVAEYSVKGKVAIEKGVSVVDVFSLVTNFNIDDFTVDLSLRLKPKGGSAQKIKLKSLPVRDLAGLLKNIEI